MKMYIKQLMIMKYIIPSLNMSQPRLTANTVLK